MRAAFLLSILCCAGSVLAQPQPQPQPGQGQRDAIAEMLYPPELIMSHQRELGLDDKQRQVMLQEITAAQGKLTATTWAMHGAVEEMVRLLGVPRVDEAAVLAQADKVMALEREMKRVHLALLVRLRNLLTAAQREKLDELRARERAATPPR